MAWSGAQSPGARFFAGVFIWPIWTGDGAAHAIHCVITTG